MISSRLTGRDSLLFVYGTLRPFVDIAMATWLRGAARYLGPARARGRLYDLGAYPGMKGPRGRGEQVVGDVYRVMNPQVLRVLDRYEAGPARDKARFVRERCVVKLDRRGRKAAWVYAYRCSVVNAARIASGDYRLHCHYEARGPWQRRSRRSSCTALDVPDSPTGESDAPCRFLEIGLIESPKSDGSSCRRFETFMP